MTVRLILVTHAETAATREARFPDADPLTSRGREAAAARGWPHRIDRAVRGPEERCRETAEALGLSAAPLPVLADLDTGDWRGRALAEVQAEHPQALAAWLTAPDAVPHGGESVTQLITRVAGWLESIPAGPARIAAIVAPAVVRAATIHVLSAPAATFWSLDTAPLTQTWLSNSAGRWRLKETGHPLCPGP